VHVFVTGRVQGVSYRESTRRCALQEQVSGWVKNLPDGRVEAVLQGERDSVDRLLAYMTDGPPHAEVEDLQYDDEPLRDEPAGFRILR